MKLSPEDIHLLLQVAISAAHQAGRLIRRYTTQGFEILDNKAEGSRAAQALTEVDKKSENLIVETLANSMCKYDIALLTEETEDDLSRLQKEYFWCVDPIDGTLAFTKGEHGYSVSIALVNRNGVPLIGVVYDPFADVLYHAAMNCGAFKNGERWHAFPVERSNVFTWITDGSALHGSNFEALRTQISNIANLLGYSTVKHLYKGGAALNACWVLDHAPACYFKLPKKNNGGGSLWDFAATTCIFNEIGAHASNANGEILELNTPATTYMNRQGILFASSIEIGRVVLSQIFEREI